MKVAVYARVSSEDQAERGMIENQIEFAAKYCDLHQLEVAGHGDRSLVPPISLQQAAGWFKAEL